MEKNAEKRSIDNDTRKDETISRKQESITVSVNRRNAVEQVYEDSVKPEEESSDIQEVPEEIPDEGERDGTMDKSGFVENREQSEESEGEEKQDDDEDSDWLHKLDNAKKIGCISCGTVLMILIAALATFTAVFMHFYRLMDIADSDEIRFNDKVTFSDTEISEKPDGKVSIEAGDVFKDKDVFNILLLGTDDRTEHFSQNARADSIMVLSLSNKEKKVRLVSLERGMLVQIPGHKDDILTHTFRYGGSSLVIKTVRTHFRLDVDKYVRVNFRMFQKLVDEVGGVDIEISQREAYGLNKSGNGNTGTLGRKVVSGINHFNGYEALQYSRLRWIDDDFHRIERQRKVILAIKENMTDLSVSDLSEIFEDCLPYVQTNLSAVEFAGLLMNLPQYLSNDVEQMTIPQKGTYRTLGHVEFKKNAQILNQFLYGK